MKLREGVIVCVLSAAAVTATVQGASSQPADAPSDSAGGTIAPYWAFGQPTRNWSLQDRNGHTALRVTASGRGSGDLDLVFQHPQNRTVNGGSGFNVGRQRFCRNGGDPYLFLDQYIGGFADGRIRERHNIVSSRLILTPEQGPPVDLIANGVYARCGGVGQPYLRWRTDMPSYRLQAWGYLAENKQFKWYWDVQVHDPVETSDQCGGGRAFKAIEVKEAWWTNFERGHEGQWSIGSGALGSDAEPSGDGVGYGRTEWHGEGHMPWAMVKSSDGHVMCAAQARSGAELPLNELKSH